MDEMVQKCTEPPQNVEVAVIDSDVVRQIKSFGKLGWGSKRISKELGVSRNTVRRYLRLSEVILPMIQARHRGRQLDKADASTAAELLLTQAAGNAVVVQRLLAQQGVAAGLRTVQRAVRSTREQ